jgi:pyruvate dehydrogenase E2 component (dihydrolipoamide acetyltransferase)
MATVVIMPKFEMAQETGTVARWLKNEGDTVAKGEPLLEVETDKVTMEVEAPAAGILVNVTAPAGLVVPIGQPIAFIARPGEQMPAPAGALSAAKAAAPVADPMALAPAGAPAASAPVAPVAAPSGVINANYRATPLAERVASEHGLALSSIPGSGPQGRITREDVERVLASLDAASAATPALAPLWPDGKVRAVPAARRLARELSVELLTVAGSGPEGRIQPADVLAAAQRAVVAPVQAPASALVSSEPVLPAAPGGPAVRRTVPLTSIRRTIAERMTASVREAPQFSVSAEAEMARAQAMVEDVKAAGEGKDGPDRLSGQGVCLGPGSLSGSQ